MSRTESDVGSTTHTIDPSIQPVLAEFVDSGLESDYRQSHVSEDARTLIVLLLIVLPANALWLISDYLVAESGASFGMMAAVRAVMIAVGTVAIAISIRAKTPLLLSSTVVVVTIVSTAGIFFFDLTRPRDYLGHYTIDILVIVALYLVVPLPVRLKVVCAAIYSFAVLGVYFTYKETSHPDLYDFTIPLSTGLANAIGYLASRNLAIRRRREFYLFNRESEARTQLQHALDNIKTLSGLLPICAGCKKIRDDQGYWNHVEAYLGARSDVAFTHGLCPECSTNYRSEMETVE